MPGVGTTHHINLSGHYYLVKPGSYQKRAAPQFGARFSTGDPDFNNLSIWQHWAQTCWVGGMDSPEWADDAMFDDGVGIDTTTHERMTMSRGLVRGAGANWAVSSGSANSTNGFKTCIYNSILYVLTLSATGTRSHLWQYVPGTDGWTRVTSFDTPDMKAWSIATFDGKLYIGGSQLANNTGKLVYSSGALTTWTVVTNPAGLGTTSIVTAMRSFQQRLYVAYSYMIWRQKDDQTWDGNTVFYKANANSESNGIIAMETHLGFLYMLSSNGHVHRTDGNTTFDIWAWDGQTYGIAIKSFDGRLFIMTYEYTNTADTGWGVLYQMSGSAVTQLKRWGDDLKSIKIGSLVVYDRRLWYGASNLLGVTTRLGFGVACYDPIEDAHSIVASNSATGTYAPGAAPYTNYIVDDVQFFQGRMFAFVRGHGAFITGYKYRDWRNGFRGYDITAAGGSLVALNGGFLTTSTYDAGTPGVRKLWRKAVIDAAIPVGTGIVIDYSLDGGVSWLGISTISVATARKHHEFWLNNLIGTSLKLRFTLRSTVDASTPTIYGFYVSYIPIPEPNWLWTMTLVLSESQQLLDGTTASMDTEAELAFLRDMYRTKQLVTFVDVDGSQWAAGGVQPGVLVYDIAFLLRSLTQPLEGEVQLTLLESVETY